MRELRRPASVLLAHRKNPILHSMHITAHHHAYFPLSLLVNTAILHPQLQTEPIAVHERA